MGWKSKSKCEQIKIIFFFFLNITTFIIAQFFFREYGNPDIYSRTYYEGTTDK